MTARTGFLFHERHLIMYNGALWNGWRTWAFDLHGPDGGYGGMTSLGSREQRQYDRYQEEHAALFVLDQKGRLISVEAGVQAE